MAKINAKTTGGGGIETVGDASGVLELQSDGTTVINATTVSGNPRITGDFSNATQANRTAFQSSTANGNTVVASIPNGTASTTAWNAFNNSVITNASLAQMLCTSSEASIRAERTGTGAYLPMTFQTGGSERMRIDSSGIVMVGGTTARTSQAKIELTSPANTALSLYMFKTGQVEATLGFKSSTDSNFYIGSGSTSVGTNGVFLTNTGNSWSSVSDERQKNIIEPIENAVEKIITLRTVIGSYKNDDTNTRRPFLIAQDVQKVLPEAVSISDQETETLGMSYTDTIPLLVAAIKELNAKVEAQAEQIKALQGAV
jgi:hypothetical protein